MIETEISAEITQDSFTKYFDKFSKEFGQPQKVKRIAFMVIERGKKLDNRLKITNGKVELVQKYTISVDESGKRIKEEITIELNKDLDTVNQTIKLMENFYKANDTKPFRCIVQHENYLWLTKGVEIKLSKQFGKNNYYVYEVEAMQDNINVNEVEQELGLNPDADLNSQERRNYRAEQVDLNMDELTQKEVEELIIKYLAF